MWIRYGNQLINLDATFSIDVEVISDNHFSVYAVSTEGIKTEIEGATPEGATIIMDTIFKAICAGKSTEVDK